EQIHEDDLEEMDLKWQLALLSMRARRYFQGTGKKITINGSDNTGYNKTKVECFNCYKMGHFSRECKSPRNQESMPRNQDNSRKTVNVEDTFSKAMVAIDGAGFDWIYMDDDEVPTNMALMAFSDSKKALDALIIEDWVSDSDEDEYEETVLKYENVQHKPEQANQPRKMVQKPVLKNVEKGMVQSEVSPVWNNEMRTNNQNFSNSRRNFAPIAVLTKTDIVPISTARQSSSRAATPVSAARPINTAASKPLVNVAKPRQNALQIIHSLSRRPFYQQTTIKNRNLNNNVNTAKANYVNTAKRNNVTSFVGN
nr:ribonuclease H-like domain-containing protein [Tanacetum cinerariifolium]